MGDGMQMNRKFGWIRDLPDHRDLKYALSNEIASDTALIRDYDLRGVLTIKDQGNYGTCVSHGTSSALEFNQILALKNKTHGPEVFNPNTYSPVSRMFINYNTILSEGGTDFDGGCQIRDAIKCVRNVGICEEKLWPYQGSLIDHKPAANAYQEALKHEIPVGLKIDHTSQSEMLSCLNAGFPFIIGVALFSSFRNITSNGLVSLPSTRDSFLGGHCMLVVGYIAKLDLWIVQNSWGLLFGDKGFCYIPGKYFRDLGSDFWTLRNSLVSLKRQDFEIGGGR